MKWFQNSFHNSLTWKTDNATHVTLTQRSQLAGYETWIILVACPAPSCLNTPVLSFAQLLSHSIYNLFHQQLLWSLCHRKQPDTGELASYSGAKSSSAVLWGLFRWEETGQATKKTRPCTSLTVQVVQNLLYQCFLLKHQHETSVPWVNFAEGIQVHPSAALTTV